MAGTPTIDSLIAQWVEAFNDHDLDRHMALYTADALLFGSVDALQDGREAIRSYFANRPAGARVVSYPPPRIRELANGSAVTSGHVVFTDGQQLMPYRLSWTLVRTGGDWRIAQHHGSPQRGT